MSIVLRPGASGTFTASASRTPRVHTTERWAAAVVRVLHLDADVRTIDEWARTVGLSASALKARCQAAGAQTKASLDLARLLRALSLSRAEGWKASFFLDTVDPRTQRRLFRLGQLSRGEIDDGAGLDLRAFIARQQFVTAEPLRRALCDTLDVGGHW